MFCLYGSKSFLMPKPTWSIQVFYSCHAVDAGIFTTDISIGRLSCGPKSRFGLNIHAENNKLASGMSEGTRRQRIFFADRWIPQPCPRTWGRFVSHVLQAWTLVLYQHVVTKAVGNSRSLWFGKAGASILSSKKQILRARPFPSFSKIWSAGISALIQSSAGSSSPNFRNCNTKLWLRLALQPITVRKKENVVVIQLCCSFCIVQHVGLSKHV